MTAIKLRPLVPPTTLTEVPSFKRRYSSDSDDLIHDFFVPALSCAAKYDRAVGYFTAGALARLAPALDAFLDQEGTIAPIRVVASPNLPKIDLQHMELGYKQRTIEQECTQHRPEFSDALSAVTWMIQHNLMEFWLVTGYADGAECLYHEKIGVIEDAKGNYLTFEGSPNETAAGLGRTSSHSRCTDPGCLPRQTTPRTPKPPSMTCSIPRTHGNCGSNPSPRRWRKVW